MKKPSSRSPGWFGRAWRECVALRLLGAFAVACPAAAAPWNEWAFRQTVQVPTSGVVRFALPPETFNAAQPSLADLRLADPAGAEVPFLLERPRATTRAVRPQTGWQVFLEANRTRIEIDLPKAARFTSLSVETPAPVFLKAASLTGAAQGAAQALLQAYPLFRQPGGAAQMRLKIPDGAWTHLTLTLDDTRSAPIPITGLLLQEEDSAALPLETGSVTLGERIDTAGETRLTIDLGAAHLPLAGLRFQTDDPLFVRRVNVVTRQWTNGEVQEPSLGGGIIYRVAVEGSTNAAQLDLTLETQSPTRELTLVIDNGDSPPLPIRGVMLLRRPVYQLFLARQAGAFHLLSGHPRVAAPRYDVGALSAPLKSATVSWVEPGPLGANPDFRPSEPLPEIPFFAAALDVAPWRFRRVVKTGPGAVQQLELTPHVLAHAQAGLGDVRLVASGKQVPFILERAGFTRAFTPEVSRDDDPKQPSVSRWTIRLPQARLPVTKISCETKAVLYQREANIEEEMPNSQGRGWRVLGSASWVRRPESKADRLNMMLTSMPQGDVLRLVVSNGNDSPLDFEKFEFFLPVTRVLFKAPPGVAVELCYGNGTATAPSYDLNLVAPQILAAAKSDATLSEADPTHPVSREFNGKSVSLLFFGALALVVAVLLVVIMRLLPKPGNPA